MFLCCGCGSVVFGLCLEELSCLTHESCILAVLGLRSFVFFYACWLGSLCHKRRLVVFGLCRDTILSARLQMLLTGAPQYLHYHLLNGNFS